MNPVFIHASEPTGPRAARAPRARGEIALTGTLFFLPNLALTLHFTGIAAGFQWPERWKAPFSNLALLPLDTYLLWLAGNLVGLGLFFTLHRLLVQPLSHIARQLQPLRRLCAHESPAAAASCLHLPRLARDIGRFASFALEHYRKHLEATQALEQARQVIAQFALEQQLILSSAHREIGAQYRAVLSYAHYLEEHVARRQCDPALRYDLDDVCESSFNLKIIAGALAVLGTKEPLPSGNVALAPLMQQTMLTLAPALDRRSMKLTTADVDLSVTARGDAGTLAQILWMMLLGMIRYAADESTLHLRCLRSGDGTRALLSIVVSELSPNRLSEEERGDYLARRLKHLTPHMFAETIRIHGNIQLANLLIQRMEGAIRVLPLTVSSCEICMELPAAAIPDSGR